MQLRWPLVLLAALMFGPASAQQQSLGGDTSVASGVNVTVTGCSASIQTGGTAQQAFGASPSRHGFILANIDTTEVLWFSFTFVAAPFATGSYPLAPATSTTMAGLASFTSPIGMGINTPLSVYAATAGHKFSCSTW
jgi:hypothetical protein